MHSNGSMNRVYRLIWSDVQSCWIAVAESGRGRGKGSSSKLIAAALSLTAAFAQAGPVGGQVVSGTGSVTQSGATTTIQQTSQNLSLNWQSFNIAPQEKVNFVQPSASAIAVNRIFDTNGTKILGQLNANGQVYLINPNGILFGQGAQVNVGALVASTLDFNDASLNGSTRTFSGSGSGSIVNQGTINATGTGGYVALLGNTVSNQGTITAPQGAVALGAGSAATLTFQNNSLVKMQVDQSVLNSLAENGGLIRADGGMVVLSAGAKDALLASVVNNTGVIEARTVQEHNGTIILLGGMAAGTTYVSGTLDASAPNGGNGGFIETSAAIVKVADDTRVMTSAPAGITGTWLIDPTNFTIAAGSGASTTNGIGASTLSSNLGSGNVSIATSATGSEAGDIFVNSAVSWSANKLTLSAHRNININAELNASNTASLALNYGQGAVAAGNTSQITTTGAAVNLPAGTSNFTTLQGSDGTAKAYTVITSLGAAASTTATDLQGINGAPAANYALGSNIDAAPTSTAAFGTTGFAPIRTFAGTFDGLGHTVSGLFINAGATANTGLFGLVGSGTAIRNIGLLGGSVTGGASTGALVGYNGVGSAVHNSYATGNVTGAAGTGGLIGSNTTGTITNSYATGNVTGAVGTGGLLGSNTTGAITNSYATGNVNNGAFASIGGMLGAGTTGAITNSYATGSVTGGAGAGGLVGDFTTGNITNSYAIGAVSGNAGAGGLVGTITTGAITNTYATGSVAGAAGTGGLVGVGTTGVITTSYATGLISGAGAGRGGLIGTTDAAHVGSFWDTQTTGMATSLGGADVKGMTTAQMKDPLNFTTANGNANPAGNAASTWTLNSVNYPLLTSLLSNVATVTADSRTQTYRGAAFTTGYTATTVMATGFTGTLSGAATFSGSSQTEKNVGSRVITPGGLSYSGSNNPQNAIKFVDGTLTIAPAPVSISGVRAYDGSTTLAASIFSLSGLVSGQDLTFSGSGSMANQNVGIGKPVSSLGTLALSNGNVGLSSNYTLVGGTGQVQVNAAALTITAGSVRKTYDGTLAATGTGNVTSGSLFGTDTLSSSGLAFTDKNVGNRNKTVTANGVSVLDGNGGGNYQVSYVGNTTSTIDPRALNVIAQAADKIYDGKTTASVALSDNRVAGDVLTLGLEPSLTGSPTSGSYISITGAGAQIAPGSSGANFADKNAEVGKTVFVVGIQVQGTDAGNYTANTTALSTAAITPKALTVVAAGKNKVYDGTTTNALILSSSGVVRGDNLLLTGSGTFADANAGTAKAVAVTGITASGGDMGNYSLSNTTASTTANVTPKIITVTASGTDKVYDGTTSGVVNLSSSGVLQQDLSNVQFNAASAFTNKNVGVRKVVAVSNISASGDQSGNYQVKNSTATAYATVAAKNIVVDATGIDKVYDGSTKGVVNLSSDDVFSGDTVNFTSTSAVFADKNVGDGKAMTVSGIRLTGTDARNYTNNARAISSADITPKSIAVTATGSSMVYNATQNVPVTLASSGILRGDSVSFTNTSALLDNKNVGINKLVTVSGISALGSDARNYALSNSTATARATVTPLSITVTATGVNKAFDGTSNGTVSLQSLGVIGDDLLSFASTSARFANSAVGVNKVVTVSGVIAFGTDAMNYRVVNKTVATGASITPK